MHESVTNIYQFFFYQCHLPLQLFLIKASHLSVKPLKLFLFTCIASFFFPSMIWTLLYNFRKLGKSCLVAGVYVTPSYLKREVNNFKKQTSFFNHMIGNLGDIFFLLRHVFKFCVCNWGSCENKAWKKVSSDLNGIRTHEFSALPVNWEMAMLWVHNVPVDDEDMKVNVWSIIMLEVFCLDVWRWSCCEFVTYPLMMKMWE